MNSQFAEIVSRFKRIESTVFKKNNFELDVWYDVRFNVFTSIVRQKNILLKAHSRKARKCCFIQKLLNAVNDNILMNPFWHLCQRTDYLFIGSSRRKKEDDKYSDIYTDPIVDELHDPNTLTLESSYDGGHLKPAKTKRIAYLDFLYTIERFCCRNSRKVPPEIAAKMDEVQDEINKEFHTELQISKLAIRKYFYNRYKERIFAIVLKRLRPKLVFLVCSYGNEAFVRAAKSLNIPTIEIQHGVINNFHLGYSYNKQLPKSSFPDFFFSFGRTWKDTTDLPVEKDRIYDIGFPHLEMQFARQENKVKVRQVVFLSQGVIGKQLSQFAVEFAKKNASFKVVYKLHPGEVSRWLTDYTSLRKASVDNTITVIDGEEPSLYNLLAESLVQVGVSSTALFEGIKFGCQTYLVNLPTIEYMEDLVRVGIAEIVSTPEELVVREHLPVKQGLIDGLFAPDWRTNLREAIGHIESRTCRKQRSR